METTHQTVNFDIDLVYLWVDGNDPKWQAKRNATIGGETGTLENCKGRFANNDELRHSLRSVELYAPWIRKIFIVTDDQTPEWLDTDHPKIQMVDHTEIMPPQSLPNFNATVIEHFLYRIPGLAEHFIFSNDDMFINRPLTPEFFFTPEGMPIIRFNSWRLRKMFLSFKEKFLGIPQSTYNRNIRNAVRVVEQKYGIHFDGKTHHNIDAYLKSDCQRTFEAFKEELEPTFVNHKRSMNDIQRNLYSYMALVYKHGTPVYVNQKTSFRLHISNSKRYTKLKQYNPMLFCINDTEKATDEDREKATAFLRARFPNKSSFEK